MNGLRPYPTSPAIGRALPEVGENFRGRVGESLRTTRMQGADFVHT